MARRPVAVLISGRGSNLQSLIDHAASAEAAYAIALVLSDVPNAGGLARAERAGIRTQVIERGRFAGRAAFDAALDEAIAACGAEFVCLAGFMRVLGPTIVERWRDRMTNIHPSLLPCFPGLHTHERALAAGVRVHGCTVHLVRPELDAGPILVQGIVPVAPGDDADRLAARVLEVEHQCYPLALDLLASGRVQVDGETARVDGPTLVVHPAL